MPSCGEPHELLHGERQHPEHKMGHHLGGPSNTDCAAAEIVFDSCVHALHDGALFEALLLSPTELPRWFGRKNNTLTPAHSLRRIHNRYMPQFAAVLFDRFGIV